jgi:GNAT superfamily N-acetyltransferase
MENDLIIREPGPGDAAALADLATQLGYPSTAKDITRRLGLLDGDTLRRVFVAEVGGAVVGWVDVFARRMLLADGMAEVNGLVVGDDQRGRGIGVQLMEAAETWATSMGCEMMRVRSNVIRERAHRFYTERLGYEVVKQQMVFGKTLEG